MMTLSLIWPVTAKGFVLSVTREATTAAGGIAESRRPREIFDGPAEQSEDNYLSNAATDFVTPSAELRRSRWMPGQVRRRQRVNTTLIS
ncbi:MAG: hypothetical protein QOG19_266 [Mycobacterium sp.]|nr:hypothetical protein [Mycobacterium sp.]